MNIPEIFMCIILSLACIVWILGEVYLRGKLRLMKWLYHDIFGWHIPDKRKKPTVEVLMVHCTCLYCRKKIYKDDFGNWKLW